MAPSTDLSHRDRVVVISGGVRGIGRALTDGFLAAGARVVAFHRGESDESKAATEALRTQQADALAKGRLAILRADITRSADRTRVLATAQDAWGRLDVVINNAGVCFRDDLTVDRIGLQQEINASAPVERYGCGLRSETATGRLVAWPTALRASRADRPPSRLRAGL